jgi:Flp pilus assembly protein CpaB
MKQMSGTRLLIIAVVCGLLAAFLVVYYLKQVENKYRLANQPVVEKTLAVVVPRRDMAKGEVITLDSIGRLVMPARFVPSNYIAAEDYQKVVNRTLMSPVQAGKPITWEFITGRAAEKFSENLDLGRRAMSIRVSKIDSFDGLLRPGDTIDLMGKFELGKLGVVDAQRNDREAKEEVVMPVLERVTVLSAGREDYTGRRYERSQTRNSIDGFDMEFTIVTLHLSPRQVARVELAQQTGSLFAVLRHPDDSSLAGYDYMRANSLLEKDRPEAVDLVLDATGKPIGRIVGDNVVDANGNIIGKVVNGQAVGLDGKPLGQVVRNVAADDPLLRVTQTADLVRDAQGNVIGRVVDGKIVDARGNVIGSVDASGRAVGLDGRVIGTVQKNVALDAQGNPVDLTRSGAKASQTKMEQVVRDAQGNIIGRVVNGQVVDKDGKVIGRVDASGQAIGLDGGRLGSVEQVMTDQQGNVVGQVKDIVRDASGRVVGSVEEVVRDAQGNIIGRVVNGEIVNDKGEVIGRVGADGKAVGLDGKVLGSVEKVIRDQQGNIVGQVEQVVRDAQGRVIGRVVNGQILNEKGEVIGRVDKDGRAIGLDGKVLGTVETRAVGADGQEIGRVEKAIVDASGQVVGELAEVVRDAQGNIIGRLVDGKVVDATGKVIGELRDGKIVDANGNVIAEGVTVSTENAALVEAALRQQLDETAGTSQPATVDFIPGGTAKEGIQPVIKVRLE